MKKNLNLVWCILLFGALALMVARGAAVGAGVRSGLSLVYRRILPALFPTAVLCGMIGELAEYLPIPATATLWINAQLCGFPIGIKTAAHAYRRGLISQKQCLQLSRCCANASPAFLIAYLGGTLYGNHSIGLLFYGAQLGISFLIAYRNDLFRGAPPLPQPPRSITAILTESIGNAATGCLTLTGFITVFSALAALCEGLPYFSYWYGLLELTGGISALPPRVPLWYCGVMIGFSSLSVLLQNSAFLLSADLSPLPMIRSKLLYAACFAGTAFLPKMALFFFFFVLFLISFDKWRKKRYNKANVKENGEVYDFFQRD